MNGGGQRSLQLNIVDLRSYHIPTPVAHWTDKKEDQTPDLSRIKKIVAETWHGGLNQIGQKEFEGEILVALDEEKLHQEVMSHLGSEQYRVAPLDPNRWNATSPPGTIHLCSLDVKIPD